MLASKFLLHSKEVEKVKQGGKLLQSQNFGVFVYQNRQASVCRFAFIISSKISKLAVHRNRVKRALNEVVRMNLSKIPKGYDFVFLVKKSIVSKTTEDIMRETQNFFSSLSSRL